MGVFDGVHRGHVALARTTSRAARERNAAAVALVFEPHPDEVVRPGTVVPRLAPVAENLRRLQAAGIDHPLVVRFDAELRALEPAAFLAAMAPAIELRALVMTPESAFGRNRAGTPGAMRLLGASAGFDLVVADDVVREDGVPISSARVRAALSAGDVATAVRLLGHPLELVAAMGAGDPGGDARRRLDFGYPPALPAPGRYPVRVRVEPAAEPVEGTIEVDAGSVWLDAAADPASVQLNIELDASR